MEPETSPGRPETGNRSERTVDVRSDGIDVNRVGDDAGVAEARRRFGGVDVPAVIAGMLAALGTTLLVGGLLAALLGTVGYQVGLDGTDELSAGGLIGGLITLLVSFLLGGWVAGRMSRYDGGRNGWLTGVAFFLLAAVTSALGAVLGARFNVFSGLQLPQWFSSNAFSAPALLSGLLALGVMLLAGWLGGKVGERYHRRADALVLHTRDGGIAAPGSSRRIHGVTSREMGHQ